MRLEKKKRRRRKKSTKTLPCTATIPYLQRGRAQMGNDCRKYQSLIPFLRCPSGNGTRCKNSTTPPRESFVFLCARFLVSILKKKQKKTQQHTVSHGIQTKLTQILSGSRRRTSLPFFLHSMQNVLF